MIFFFYFAWDCSNLGDCLATKEVGNLKRNVMATSGLNVSSVTPLFLELWPIEIKNQVILCFFSILHGIVQTQGIFLLLRRQLISRSIYLLPLGKRSALQPQQFGSPYKLKKGDFLYIAWDCSNLRDILITQDVGNHKRNVRATCYLATCCLLPDVSAGYFS